MAVATTLVFTDIVDSTRHVERLGDEAAAALWARHDRLARDAIQRHHGREIDRTDGFFAIFARADDAANFAGAYHDVTAQFSLQARVALHTGAVTLRENDAGDIARGAKPRAASSTIRHRSLRAIDISNGDGLYCPVLMRFGSAAAASGRG